MSDASPKRRMKRPNPAGLALLAAGFLVLAMAARFVGVLPGDVWIRYELLTHASPAVTSLFGWLTYAGDWRVVWPAMPVLLAFPRIRRHWGLWVVFILAAPMLGDHILKALVARPRPESPDFGFPSGHASGAAAFMSGIAYGAATFRPLARRVVTIAASSMIVLVALARILLHAHWPSDVLGGALLGLAFTACAALITADVAEDDDAPRRRAVPCRGASKVSPQV
jgi:membrane-associated phospholipid phosphatase